jgi:hypothetical protein
MIVDGISGIHDRRFGSIELLQKQYLSQNPSRRRHAQVLFPRLFLLVLLNAIMVCYYIYNPLQRHM